MKRLLAGERDRTGEAEREKERESIDSQHCSSIWGVVHNTNSCLVSVQ